MDIKYRKDHLTCDNYEKGNKATIQTLFLEKDEVYEREIIEAEIAFVREGSLKMSYLNVSDQTISDNQVVLLPPACNILIKTEVGVSVLLIKMDSNMKLCNTYAIENLFKEDLSDYEEGFLLNTNSRIDKYLELMTECITDGIRCKHYLNMKLQELLYYFRLYYSKEDLRNFFAPMLTNDSSFATFVFQNYKKAKNVQQLSGLYGYSQSSFEKQFKRIFGVSAYQWMVDKKAKQIYHRLTCSDKTFVEIADEYDFSSSSQFCDFCKHFIGGSPKEIRQKKVRYRVLPPDKKRFIEK